jgi:hypothetical protein
MDKRIIYSLIGMFILGSAIILYLNNNGNIESQDFLKENFGIDLQPSVEIIENKIVFRDKNLSSTDISVSAKILGVDVPLDSVISSYFIKEGKKTKFGYNFTVSNTAIESISFHLNSSYELFPMGDATVGYWLKGNNNLIENFHYDFSDILKIFTINETSEIREIIDGAWTGKYIKEMIQKPVLHTITTDKGNAVITFDLSKISFKEGQVIDLDPIGQTGSALEYGITTANSGTVSSAITVPADAEIVIVGVSGYAPFVSYFSNGNMTFTKGGVNTTMVSVTNNGDSDTTAFMSAMFYLVSPDTGTNKILKWDWDGTSVSDTNSKISVIFFKGIDTSSPVRDTDGEQAANMPYTTPSLTAQSGDLIVAWVGAFAAAEGSVNSWGNLSLITQVARYVEADGAWASNSSLSGNTSVSALTDTNLDDGGIVAVVIKPSTADTTSPKWQTNSSNSTLAGSLVLHSTNWTDDTALAGYIFSFANGSATFVNDSWVAMTGISNWSNVTKGVNTTIGSTIQWKVYANDSSDNKNVTSTFSYTTTSAGDSTAPKFQNIGVNNTNPAISDYVLFSVNWTDDTDLSSYIFGWNATGINCDTWANDSAVSFTGVQNWSNVTKQIPATCLLANVPGIGFRIYANDNSNNWNETGIQQLFTGELTCWSYSSLIKTLFVPSGCTYYQTGSGYV